MFFLKTGNVLSEKSIFNVNNIEIETKNYLKNNDEYLNQAFIQGFNELTQRILLKKDYIKLKKLTLYKLIIALQIFSFFAFLKILNMELMMKIIHLPTIN